ncbi:hypothetical protein Plhal304r1_c057g0143881 [Plasmopara halstedii]
MQYEHPAIPSGSRIWHTLRVSFLLNLCLQRGKRKRSQRNRLHTFALNPSRQVVPGNARKFPFGHTSWQRSIVIGFVIKYSGWFFIYLLCFAGRPA